MALASLGGEAQFIASYFGNGFDAKSLNEGLNTGQYEFPAGVNYGGQSPAQQTEFLRQELGPLLARPYRKVLFLDFTPAWARTACSLSFAALIHQCRCWPKPKPC